jgi:hypothetical protein
MKWNVWNLTQQALDLFILTSPCTARKYDRTNLHFQLKIARKWLVTSSDKNSKLSNQGLCWLNNDMYINWSIDLSIYQSSCENNNGSNAT